EKLEKARRHRNPDGSAQHGDDMIVTDARTPQYMADAYGTNKREVVHSRELEIGDRTSIQEIRSQQGEIASAENAKERRHIGIRAISGEADRQTVQRDEPHWRG